MNWICKRNKDAGDPTADKCKSEGVLKLLVLIGERGGVKKDCCQWKPDSRAIRKYLPILSGGGESG